MCDRWTRSHVWLKSKFWKAILKLIFRLYIQIKISRPRYEFYVKTYSSKLVFLEPQISIQTWFWIFDLSQKWFRGIGNLSSLVENIWSSVTIRVKRSCKFRGAMCKAYPLQATVNSIKRGLKECWLIGLNISLSKCNLLPHDLHASFMFYCYRSQTNYITNMAYAFVAVVVVAMTFPSLVSSSCSRRTDQKHFVSHIDFDTGTIDGKPYTRLMQNSGKLFHIPVPQIKSREQRLCLYICANTSI